MKFRLNPGTKLLDISFFEITLLRPHFYQFGGAYRKINGAVYAIISRQHMVYYCDPILLVP